MSPCFEEYRGFPQAMQALSCSKQKTNLHALIWELMLWLMVLVEQTVVLGVTGKRFSGSHRKLTG